MIRQLIPSLSLAAALWLISQPARAAQFTVLDQKAPAELSEITRLYVDGGLVATVRLDASTRAVTIPVTVPDSGGPDGRQHDYVLCGEITFRDSHGATSVHEVSGAGLLHDPDGRRLEALGADDFTLFYLADAADPSEVTIGSGGSSVCQQAIS